MDSKRDDFLKSKWRPYPAAVLDWHDVSDFLNLAKSEGWVCGRWYREGQGEGLESGGHRLEISPPESHPWSVDDLVALHVVQTKNRWEIRNFQLLVASQAPRPRQTISVERSREWMRFLTATRAFFGTNGFTEAQTPTLVPSPGTEPFLDPFSTSWEFGRTKEAFYLPTSPEFHLKKMLAAGWTRVFELKTCFRNGEISAHHQPEFLMLEWYRAYQPLEAIAHDAEAFFKFLQTELSPPVPVPALRRTSIKALFAETFENFELRPETTRAEIASLAQRFQIRFDESDGFDEIFYRLFLEKIEPSLGADGPLLVQGYPPSQAALARLDAEGFADRFEIYWRGLEIANAFHELNDPEENIRRFEEDAHKKRAIGKPAVPVDQELISWLKYGLPPSGGIALGMDRLFMALFEIEKIEDTRAFPIKCPY